MGNRNTEVLFCFLRVADDTHNCCRISFTFVRSNGTHGPFGVKTLGSGGGGILLLNKKENIKR